MKMFQHKYVKYLVPTIALLVVALQLVLVKSYKLSKWKGGGFGMYSEVHYYLHDVVIDHLETPLDSLTLVDRSIGQIMIDVKRQPTNSNLEKMAKKLSKYVQNDTVNIQVWKPKIDSRNSTYSRELVCKHQFIKP